MRLLVYTSSSTNTSSIGIILVGFTYSRGELAIKQSRQMPGYITAILVGPPDRHFIALLHLYILYKHGTRAFALKEKSFVRFFYNGSSRALERFVWVLLAKRIAILKKKKREFDDFPTLKFCALVNLDAAATKRNERNKSRV